MFKKEKYVEQDNTEWAKYYLNKLVGQLKPYQREDTTSSKDWDISKHGFEAYLKGQGLDARDVFEKYDLRDENNPDAKLRSRQLLGLNMLSGLKKDGGEYTGGNIYDPGNGKTYNCSMKVEGDVLKVRGSLDKRGLLGRTMDWFRVEE